MKLAVKNAMFGKMGNRVGNRVNGVRWLNFPGRRSRRQLKKGNNKNGVYT
ncbi:hypothetical protein N288_21535 [Bacillus infantis NRRL B-14911]|uniref:Uncharacterized protein n=1 Tax=Bacillus infantis NRRL B-14911 TaxID=1367477 RepID=U5LHS0_9BACI|nr:hypothetical protein N288_21535 [Bacillus infantis NRRL B-14911]